MEEAAPGNDKIYPNVYYAYDNLLETYRREGQVDGPDPPGCSVCRSDSHTRPNCPHAFPDPMSDEFPFFALSIRPCNFCGTMLLGEEAHGTCCGATSNRMGISFRRTWENLPDLDHQYASRCFHRHSLHLNAAFQTVVPFASISHAVRGRPSVLRLEGTVRPVIRPQSAGYSFTFLNGPPTATSPGISDFLQQALQNPQVQESAIWLYNNMVPTPDVARKAIRDYLSEAGNTIGPPAQLADVDAEDERVLHEATVQGAAATAPFPGAAPPGTMHSYIVPSTSLQPTSSGLAHVVDDWTQETQQEDDTSTVQQSPPTVRWKRVKETSEFAEVHAHPILYPTGEPAYDENLYVQQLHDGFPEGVPQDSDDAMNATLRSLTHAKFVRRRMYTDNILQGMGKLFQRWLLWHLILIDDKRLNFVTHADGARMLKVRDVQTAAAANQPMTPSSGVIYVPKTHTCSPAYYKERRKETAAVRARLGEPALFLTFTLNILHPNVGRLSVDTAVDPPGGGLDTTSDKPRPLDRPDIIARVFGETRRDVERYLRESAVELFGSPVIGMSARVEYQQRGVPHMHMILWLDDGPLPIDQIDDHDGIPATVVAEMPRADNCEELGIPLDLVPAARAEVLRYHRHHHSEYCKKNSSNCRFGYPRDLVSATTFCYSTKQVLLRRRLEEDRIVVSYNPALLLRYRMHFNVVPLHGDMNMGYIWKYIYKTSASTIKVSGQEEQSPTDSPANAEDPRRYVLQYQEGRQVGSVEAAFRLRGSPNYTIQPTVQTFQAVPNAERHILVMNPQNSQAVPSVPFGDMNRYFSRPHAYESCTMLAYYEKVSLYALNKVPQWVTNAGDFATDTGDPPNVVAPRNRPIVARLNSVSPSNVEGFSYRLLVLDVPARSEAGLRTVNNVTYSTFKEAASARGMFQDGNEYHLAIVDAAGNSGEMTPQGLRFFLLMSRAHIDIDALILECLPALVCDLGAPADASVEDQALLVRKRLIGMADGMGQDLRHVSSFSHAASLLDSEASALGQDNATELGRLRAEIDAFAGAPVPQYDSLNNGQRAAAEFILDGIRHRAAEPWDAPPRLFFLQGAAGTGKSHTVKAIIAKARSEGFYTCVTATTGLAATIFNGGTTLHHQLGLRVSASPTDAQDQDGEPGLTKYGPNSQRALKLRALHLLVVDEASMLSRYLFDAMDKVLTDLVCNCNDRSPPFPAFGGCVILLVGDYLQLLPVVATALSRNVPVPETHQDVPVTPVSVLDTLPWNSPVWQEYIDDQVPSHFLRLTENVRQEADLDFADLVLSIFKGEFPEDEPLPLRSTSSFDVARKWIWPWLTTRSIADVRLDKLLVAPTNRLVDAHNRFAADNFPGPPTTRTAAVSAERLRNSDQDGAAEEFVNDPELTASMNPAGVAPHTLVLKKGMPVFVLRNVKPPELVNGRRAVLHSIQSRYLILSLPPDNVDHANADSSTWPTFPVPRIDFSFHFLDLRIIRRQFPIRPAFAATGHRCQGQTLSAVAIDTRENFFCEGQLAVAISRAQERSQVLLLHNHGPGVEEVSDAMPVPLKIHFLPQAVERVYPTAADTTTLT